ncbi:MAG: hypothetical protein Kow0090_22790 [Myxococcota bacterium]
MTGGGIAENKILKWLVAISIAFMVGKVSWTLSWEAGYAIRTIYSTAMVGIFLYLLSQYFVFSVVFFGAASIALLFLNGVFALSERYGTEFGVAFLVASLFIGGFFWWYIDHMRVRCKKCGRILEDKDLLDEETVSIYRCPKCGAITNLEFKDKYGQRPPDIDDNF